MIERPFRTTAVVLLLCTLGACSRAPDPVDAPPDASTDAPAGSGPAAASAPSATPATTPAPGAVDASANAFRKTLELQGIRFDVVDGAGRVTVTPAGLEISNEAVDSAVDGRVVDAEVADLDADGSPEIYVYVQGSDAASMGSVVAWASNKRKSLSQITMVALEDDPALAAGYRGGDAFTVIENRLGRRFPVTGEDGRPSGVLRQIAYRLAPGEAGWRLVVDQRQDIDMSAAPAR
jgi:hypothetical protein